MMMLPPDPLLPLPLLPPKKPPAKKPPPAPKPPPLVVLLPPTSTGISWPLEPLLAKAGLRERHGTGAGANGMGAAAA
jgi:hypothetical protein